MKLKPAGIRDFIVNGRRVFVSMYSDGGRFIGVSAVSGVQAMGDTIDVVVSQLRRFQEASEAASAERPSRPSATSPKGERVE